MAHALHHALDLLYIDFSIYFFLSKQIDVHERDETEGIDVIA